MDTFLNWLPYFGGFILIFGILPVILIVFGKDENKK
jgi:hypothetical protein